MPQKTVHCSACSKRSRAWVLAGDTSVSCPKCGARVDLEPQVERGAAPERVDQRSKQGTAQLADLGDAVELTLASLVSHRIEAGKRTLSAPADALLGGVALALCPDDESGAVELLRFECGMSVSRARSALEEGKWLDVPPADTLIEALTLMPLDEATDVWLSELIGGGVAPETPNRRGLSLRSVVGSDFIDLESVLRAADVDDFPTRLVALALIESALEQVADLGEFLKVQDPCAPTRDAWFHDRLIAGVFALRTARLGYLPIDGAEHLDVDEDWSLRAAPWVVAVQTEGQDQALLDVLEGMVELGYDFVKPGLDPFGLAATDEWVEKVRNTAASVSSSLTKVPAWPVSFDDPDTGLEILISEDERGVVGYVGRSGEGLLVQFDSEDFFPFALGEEGVSYAVGCAISWFLDCSISIRKRATGSFERRAGRHSARQPILYTPTPTYYRDQGAVADGLVTPPRPHIVAAHIRHLDRKRPNPSHVAAAPDRLRRRMGPHDTWVRSHQRGTGSPDRLLFRLSQHSALGDTLGLLDRESGGAGMS